LIEGVPCAVLVERAQEASGDELRLSRPTSHAKIGRSLGVGRLAAFWYITRSILGRFLLIARVGT